MDEKQTKSRKTGQYIVLCSRIALFILLILAAWQAYNIYSYWQEHPQKEYEWDAWQGPPEEAIVKANMNNDARNLMLWGVVVMLIAQYGMYLRDPDHHWCAPIVRYLNNLEDK